MTEYWVSQAKKWCDLCKIYISSNPSSIKNHELGQKHKDNVTKRLSNMREEKLAKDKKEKETTRVLLQIEEKASRSYQKDVSTFQKTRDSNANGEGIGDGSISGGNMAILWNPLIRKYVGIQQPSLFDSSIEIHVFNGFGVCPVTFDPIVIRIEYIMNDRSMLGNTGPCKVGVFTLSTETWSILSPANLPCESVALIASQVVIDRFIYWVAHDVMLDAEDGQSQSKFLSMSFDLTAKQIVEISLTDSLANRLSEIECISKLHESLVLLTYHGEFGQDVSLCSLWMMIDEQQAGVNRSFTKLYNINLLPDVTIYQLLGFRNWVNLSW